MFEYITQFDFKFKTVCSCILSFIQFPIKTIWYLLQNFHRYNFELLVPNASPDIA